MAGKLKIVSVASEMTPYAKTGGLADVTGTLPSELKALGHEVLAFLPLYRGIDTKKYGLEMVFDRLNVPIGSEEETGKVYHSVDEKGVQIYFIDHPGFFQREHLYGTFHSDYPDNDRRFIFFQRAVLETLKHLSFSPDVIHCHDWQTGLIPVYLKTIYARDSVLKNARSVFTVHNLAYQGNFPPDSLPLSGLTWDHFKYERLEFYGKISFIKGGLIYSDSLTTVSERYSQEIQTKEFGCGLENAIAMRKGHIFGVINGIDYDDWNPAKDKNIVNFDLKTIEKKQENKQILQKENDLPIDSGIPVVGIISRLVDQKGLNILIPALDEMAEAGIQFVLLGTGEEKYHKILRSYGKKHKDQFGIHIVFDGAMARRIYAGCDIFVLPSYYEPCGLAQMIALRYGTIPVVRETGGLADTIKEFNPETGEGNGFVFSDYTPEVYIEALKRALNVFKNKKAWEKIVQNAMNSDFSWTASAKQYAGIFEATKKRKISSLDN